MRMLMQPFPYHPGWLSMSPPSLSPEPSQIRVLSLSSSRCFEPVVATAGDASLGRTDAQRNYGKEPESGFIQYPVSPIPDKLKSSIPHRTNVKPSNNQLHIYYTTSLLLNSTRIQKIREDKETGWWELQHEPVLVLTLCHYWAAAG